MRRSAATLISFLDQRNEINYVLVRSYGGDFKFAGGLKDKTDKHTGQTALRELKEETGFNKKYFPHSKLRLVESKVYPASNNHVDLFELHLGKLKPQSIANLKKHLAAHDDVDELKFIRASQIDFKNSQVKIGKKTYGIYRSNCQIMRDVRNKYQPKSKHFQQSHCASLFKATKRPTHGEVSMVRHQFKGTL